MKELLLRNSSRCALVDDEDYARCAALTWYVSAQGYVVHTINRKPRNPASLYLARFVTGAPRDAKVDHRNHDKLDNCKSELRVTTVANNSANRMMSRIAGKSSAYKGVSWYKQHRKWSARVRVNYKARFLGLFVDEREAALAYNAAARRFFGEFALLNAV